MRGVRPAASIAFVASVLLALSTAAAAGDEWSPNDPLFEIDGRVVRVIASTPQEHAGSALRFRLTVCEDARASWSLPPGATLPKGSHRPGEAGSSLAPTHPAIVCERRYRQLLP